MNNNRKSQSKTVTITLPLIKKFHSTQQAYPFSFYVQSIGHNSGRPLKQPIANCFTIICKDRNHHRSLYWLCYCLWKSNAFYSLIRGSVIPFLTIGDFKKQLRSTIDAGIEQFRFEQLVKNLQLIEQLETNANKRVQLITELRVALIREVFR